MNIKTIIIVVAVLVFAGIAGTAYVAEHKNESDQAHSVLFHDGGSVIREIDSHIGEVLILPEFPSHLLTDGRIFEHWCDQDGRTYLPGTRVTVNDDSVFSAVVSERHMGQIEGGMFEYHHPQITPYEGEYRLDLRDAGSKAVKITQSTIERMASDKLSVRMTFDGDMTVVFDAVAVQTLGQRSAGGLDVLHLKDDEHVGISLFDRDGQFTHMGGGTMTISCGWIPASGNATTYVSSFSSDVSVDSTYSDGILSVVSNSTGIFGVRDGFGMLFSLNGSEQTHSVPSFIIVTSGGSEVGTYLSKGEIFEVGFSGIDGSITVTGASGSGPYKVTGTGPVTISITYVENGYAVTLPDVQTGYSLTASKLFVEEGERCILSYSLKPGYSDDHLSIFVNGYPRTIDGLGRVFINDISTDVVVQVTGVVDSRTYSVTIPEDRIGYDMSVSSEIVHHGTSYELSFELQDGYTATQDFSILINGLTSVDIGLGTVTVFDVQADHTITVFGVEPAEFRISGGENVIVKVNGVVALDATSRDIISFGAAPGYYLPHSFKQYIPTSIYETSDGYMMTADSTIPSVYMVEIGKNVVADGITDSIICVCGGESISVDSLGNYKIPSGYFDDIKGADPSTGKVVLSEDIELRSIYKVSFYNGDTLHKTSYFAEGDEIVLPEEDPKSNGMVFKDWGEVDQFVNSNKNLYAVWQSMSYKVTAGANTILTVGGVRVTEATSEDIINIVCSDGRVLPSTYTSKIPASAKAVSGGYRVSGDTVFPAVYTVTVGSNIKVDDQTACEFKVTASDKVVVEASRDYGLPIGYLDRYPGADPVPSTVMVSSDVEFPSIYKVIFKDGEVVISAYFATHGDEIIVPDDLSKKGYTFEGWNITNVIINGDGIYSTNWSPIIHTVTFGPNLKVLLDGVIIGHSNDVLVSSDQILSISHDGSLKMPIGYTGGDNSRYIAESSDLFEYDFQVLGNTYFPGLSTIDCTWTYDCCLSYTVMIGSYHTIRTECDCGEHDTYEWLLGDGRVTSILVMDDYYVLVATS